MNLENPIPMKRSILAPLLLIVSLLALAGKTGAQTYYYIDGISVSPPEPTTDDQITITLHGNLSSSGAYIVSASQMLMGNAVHISVVAADPGGLAVLVPHDESLAIGNLAAGDYTIMIDGSFVLDMAPSPQHLFTVTEGGSPCDHLDITSIQWHAFTDTAIVLHASNTDMVSELFDYPHFILFDTDGDTLAKEITQPFGISEDSWHFLEVMDGVDLPSGPFPVVLELWTDMGSVLACSWELSIDPCPDSCATLIATVQNYGGALAIGSYDWVIYDGDFEVAASGTLTMTETVQFDYDTLCLDPGHYWMDLSPNDPPTGGQPVFGVMVDHWIQGPFQPIVWSLPVMAEFDFYGPCSEGTNNVRQNIGLADLALVQAGGSMTLMRSDGRPIGPFTVIDSQGRLLHQGTTNMSTHPLTENLRSGVILIRAGDQVLRAIVINE